MSSKKKVLFIDRDGTIIIEPPVDFQIDSLEKLEFLQKSIVNLHKIATELDYELVMVTNQDGLGTKALPEDVFWNIHNRILKSFKNEGIVFSKVFIDDSYPEDKKPTRKPGIGMVLEYVDNPNYDLKNSFMIGDRLTDMEFAKNLGAKGIFINNDELLGATEINSKREELNDSIAIQTTSWKAIYQFLKRHN